MPRRKRRSRRVRVITVVLGALVIALLVWSIYSRRQPGTWQHVFATREGMIGGHDLEPHDHSCRRPCSSPFPIGARSGAMSRCATTIARSSSRCSTSARGTSTTRTGSTTHVPPASTVAASIARRPTPPASICRTHGLRARPPRQRLRRLALRSPRVCRNAVAMSRYLVGAARSRRSMRARARGRTVVRDGTEVSATRYLTPNLSSI